MSFFSRFVPYPRCNQPAGAQATILRLGERVKMELAETDRAWVSEMIGRISNYPDSRPFYFEYDARLACVTCTQTSRLPVQLLGTLSEVSTKKWEVLWRHISQEVRTQRPKIHEGELSRSMFVYVSPETVRDGVYWSERRPYFINVWLTVDLPSTDDDRTCCVCC